MDGRGSPLSPEPGAEPPSDVLQADVPPSANATAAVSSVSSTYPAPGSSPGALLAASLVRSRATYFERLSSGSRASTSGSAQGLTPVPGSSPELAAQPLHPLAIHPLSTVSRGGGGGGGGWREEEDLQQQDSDAGVDDDSVDTFFDKPSYTCYGSNVELSAATSYRCAPNYAGGCAHGKSTRQNKRPDNPKDYANRAASPAGEVAMCSSGYVRNVSARFGNMSSGGGSARLNSGTDYLFDDLVAHVGALLASHPHVEAQMGMVQGLSDRLLELQALCGTLGRKEDEVEHLRGVLHELTATRAEAIRLKVQMAECLNGLQQEYYKVLRSAQLAQGTCKQHSVRAAATRKQLVEAQAELLRYKRAVATLHDRNRRLRADNEDMASRLHTLERVRLTTDVRHSACYMAIVQAQTAVLY